MLATLNPETQQQWEIAASRADTPTTAELVTFLETRRKAFELFQNVQTSRTTIALQSPHGQLEPRSVNLKTWCSQYVLGLNFSRSYGV